MNDIWVSDSYRKQRKVWVLQSICQWVWGVSSNITLLWRNLWDQGMRNISRETMQIQMVERRIKKYMLYHSRFRCIVADNENHLIYLEVVILRRTKKPKHTCLPGVWQFVLLSWWCLVPNKFVWEWPNAGGSFANAPQWHCRRSSYSLWKICHQCSSHEFYCEWLVALHLAV